MPPAPDALRSYRRDVLASMRKFAAAVDALLERATAVLTPDSVVAKPGGGVLSLDELASAGFELIEHARDDNGDLLTEEADEMVEAIENGLLPEIEDYRERVLDSLRDLKGDLQKRMGTIKDITVPARTLWRSDAD